MWGGRKCEVDGTCLWSPPGSIQGRWHILGRQQGTCQNHPRQPRCGGKCPDIVYRHGQTMAIHRQSVPRKGSWVDKRGELCLPINISLYHGAAAGKPGVTIFIMSDLGGGTSRRDDSGAAIWRHGP